MRPTQENLASAGFHFLSIDKANKFLDLVTHKPRCERKLAHNCLK
jgi:hypothetical protein